MRLTVDFDEREFLKNPEATLEDLCDRIDGCVRGVATPRRTYFIARRPERGDLKTELEETAARLRWLADAMDHLRRNTKC